MKAPISLLLAASLVSAGCATDRFARHAEAATDMQSILLERALEDCGPDMERVCMLAHHATDEQLDRLLDTLHGLRNADSFQAAMVHLGELQDIIEDLEKAMEATK